MDIVLWCQCRSLFSCGAMTYFHGKALQTCNMENVGSATTRGRLSFSPLTFSFFFCYFDIWIKYNTEFPLCFLCVIVCLLHTAAPKIIRLVGSPYFSHSQQKIAVYICFKWSTTSKSSIYFSFFPRHSTSVRSTSPAHNEQSCTLISQHIFFRPRQLQSCINDSKHPGQNAPLQHCVHLYCPITKALFDVTYRCNDKQLLKWRPECLLQNMPSALTILPVSVVARCQWPTLATLQCTFSARTGLPASLLPKRGSSAASTSMPATDANMIIFEKKIMSPLEP